MEDILLLMEKEIVLDNILRDNSTCNAERQIPLILMESIRWEKESLSAA